MRLFSRLTLALALLAGGLAGSPAIHAELAAEKIPSTLTLPATYPDSWIFAHDANFDALIAGRVVILDVAASTREYKGALDAAQFGSFTESSGNELYVGESFYSRGTRGERTDVISIYDRATLNQIGEVVLPGGKRAQIVTNKYVLRLTQDERFLLVYNFTPAASVTVVDVEKRSVAGEIDIAGCSMVYPSGVRGFASLCGDGSLLYVRLEDDGSADSKKRYKPFFDVDGDALFDKPAYIGGVAYFPTYGANVQPVRMTGRPRVLDSWSLLQSDADRAEKWAPGGWQIATGNDDAGLLYVLMKKDSSEGSHKGGGEEVWVYDTEEERRVRRIKLNTMGFSIEVTGGRTPYLVVTNVLMGIDIYRTDGTFVRSIGGAAAMPILLHSKR